METLTRQELNGWMTANRMQYMDRELRCSFHDAPDFVFRIPIGDYLLQLDYRIRQALALIPEEENLLVFRGTLEWDIRECGASPLDAVLRLGIPAGSCAIRLPPAERNLAFVLAYLTNRWGRSRDSICIVSEERPRLMLEACSPESLFVRFASASAHNAAVQSLSRLNIPAYGPLITEPLDEPIYEKLLIGNSEVAVDPATGKPMGAGSPESILLPAFLPRE